MNKVKLKIYTPIADRVGDLLMTGSRNYLLRDFLKDMDEYWYMGNTADNNEECLHISNNSTHTNYNSVNIELHINGYLKDILCENQSFGSGNPRIIREIFEDFFLNGAIYVLDTTRVRDYNTPSTAEKYVIRVVADYNGVVKMQKNTQKIANELFLLHGTGMLRDPNTGELLPIFKPSGQVGEIGIEFRKKIELLLKPFIDAGKVPSCPDGVIEILFNEHVGTVSSWLVEAVVKVCSDLQWAQNQKKVGGVTRVNTGAGSNTASIRNNAVNLQTFKKSGNSKG